MGADQFQDMAFGRNADEAFRGVKEAALYESGHGGYTGTIAEKDGYRMIDISEGPRSWEKALELIDAAQHGDKVAKKHRAWAEGIVDRHRRILDDKWEPAACIEITNKAEVKRLKAAAGFKGTQKRVFVFFGWASS